MEIALLILFSGSILALAHSYLIYPFLLNILAGEKGFVGEGHAQDDADLPSLSLFMAVYNEEKVLREKLDSIFATSYPLDKIQVLIGSDSSTDASHEILQSYAQKYPQLQFEVYSRRGKAMILNALQEHATGQVYVYTDANVIFHKDLLYQLVKHFKDARIGQVGARFLNKGMQADGISVQESSYIARETRIKRQEGALWGTMMGAFGGCHAIRAEAFVPNPPNFLMEDFYISLHILSLGYQAILEPQALVYEDVPNEVDEEFKRKIRISAGNFQNLSVYYKLLFPPYTGLAFSFLSHKVLRWLGPFFLLAAFLSSAALALYVKNLFYITTFILLLGALFFLPLLDNILKRMNIHISLLRFVSYFLAMNWALFQGFITYIKGVRSNVWQPTKRSGS